jgi:acetyl-CoA carboxylase biotin carboxylase subunit
MIKKILIANRGEIAVRIIRSCREMGIETIAVYSEADRTALHVRYADEAYFIGPSPSVESYLNKSKIIEVAKKAGADAIHPGYGFLSENADFCEMVNKENIIFIGPSPHAIRTMGDKITARRTMINNGVPIVPGINENLPEEEMVTRILKEIGLPVMIKASAGGGGKGMRLVFKEEEILPSVRAAKSEAKAAFGNDTVYIEKYVQSPHHIEFQVLADKHGHVIHLMERECSVQRRHQKVVEETPSPIMTAKLRQEMGEHAVMAAKAANYEGAGTIEFLVDDNLNYYFLEMNTRLQVEHPITERVTGVDLVKEQIKIASGEILSYEQKDIFQDGHAIECRIYAEDADQNFMPSPGRVQKITEPMGFGVRCDGYVYEGYEIPIYYDPMISKLITWGKTRDEAIQRMRRSLQEYYIMGVKTSINFLEKIMETRDFVKGTYNTGFIEKNGKFLFGPCGTEKLQAKFEDIALITAYIHYKEGLEKVNKPENGKMHGITNWKNFIRKKGQLRY